MKNLLSLIQEQKDRLPKRQQVLCEYMLNHPVETCMMTIAELAEKAGIGTATVVRTIQALGYESVNQFKNDLRGSAFLQAASSYNAYLDMGNYAISGEDPLQESLAHYGDYVKSLSCPALIAQVNRAAEQIVKARRVFILGLRTSMSVAVVLEHYLRDMGITTVQMSMQSEYVFDHIAAMTPEDLLLCVVSFPATKRTMETLRVCQRHAVPTVVITTTDQIPEIRMATAAINMDSFGSMFFTTSAMLAAELLSVAVNRHIGHSSTHAKRLERLLDENKLTIWEND